MQTKKTRIILEDQESNFLFNRSKSNINVTFNRIAFIFFILCIVSLIYSIHLIHLGSRAISLENFTNFKPLSNNLYRADIVDRNGSFLVKTVSSIDIGISAKKVIDKKRLLLNLRYIFPDKDYSNISSKFESKNFFYFEKKISEENYEKIMQLGDKACLLYTSDAADES